jgi:hypothetical protein
MFMVMELPISGTTVFEIVDEGNGEFFEITGGKFEGVNNLGVAFSAELIGRLDCAAGKFEGQIINGSYVYQAQTYHYEGWAIADYDRIRHCFVNGTWGVTEPTIPENRGDGTWEACWVP